MRDLTARLRDIVRKNPPPDRPAARELTYVPDVEGGHDPDAVAGRLGGVIHETDHGRCVVVDHAWNGDDWHGHGRVGSMTLAPDAPLGLFDPRLARVDGWAERVVFFDIETTGLSGGAGTLAFLAGCGWFEGDRFVVRQFFLNGPAGERAMLDGLAAIFERASLLVTYNGRTFDVPTMESRWAFHRQPCPTDDLPHFDMLPPARRLWGWREDRAGNPEGPAPSAESRESCSLTALERAVLGFHRFGDVPGFEIPLRYFQFLRTGEVATVEGVLEHNRLDLISLAAVTARAVEMARSGPEVCREDREQVGLGRLYERADDVERAMRAYRLAASGNRSVRVVALSRLAELLRRADRHEEAAAAWEQVAGDAIAGQRGFSRLERRAVEALAIHLEHRVRDPLEAKRYAELLRRDAAGRHRDAAEHRLGRLERKVRRAPSAQRLTEL